MYIQIFFLIWLKIDWIVSSMIFDQLSGIFLEVIIYLSGNRYRAYQRDCIMIFWTSVVFPKKIIPGPLAHVLKQFQYGFKFAKLLEF